MLNDLAQAAAAKIQDLQAQLEKRQQQLLEANKREQVMLLSSAS